jgi:hypothetical protein
VVTARTIHTWIRFVFFATALLHAKAKSSKRKTGSTNKQSIYRHNKPTQLGFYIEKPATSGGVFHRQQVFLQTTVRELRGWY